MIYRNKLQTPDRLMQNVRGLNIFAGNQPSPKLELVHSVTEQHMTNFTN